MDKCLNCGQEITGNFCSNCGQAKIEKSITLKSVLSDFLQVVLLIESPLFKTVKAMVVAPGKFINDYFNGHRKAFMMPIPFFLFLMTIYLVFFHLIGNEFFRFINNSLEFKSSQQAKIGFSLREMQAYISRNMNLLYFLLPPILAFFIRTFFKKTKINYGESLVFSFYLVASGFLFSSFIMVLALANIKFMILRVLILFLYIPFALIQFSKTNILDGILRSFAVVILSYFSYGLMIASITFISLKIIK